MNNSEITEQLLDSTEDLKIPSPKPERRIFIVLLAAVVLLLAIGGVYYFFFNSKRNSEYIDHTCSNGVKIGDYYYFTDNSVSLNRVLCTTNKTEKSEVIYNVERPNVLYGLYPINEKLYFFTLIANQEEVSITLNLNSLDISTNKIEKVNEYKQNIPPEFHSLLETGRFVNLYGGIVYFNNAFYFDRNRLEASKNEIIKIDLNGNVIDDYFSKSDDDILSLTANGENLYCIVYPPNAEEGGVEILDITNSADPETLYEVGNEENYETATPLYCDKERLIFLYTDALLDASTEGKVQSLQFDNLTVSDLYNFDRTRVTALDATDQYIYTSPNYKLLYDPTVIDVGSETSTPDIEIDRVDWHTGEEETFIKTPFYPSEYTNESKANIYEIYGLHEFGDQIFYGLNIAQFQEIPVLKLEMDFMTKESMLTIE